MEGTTLTRPAFDGIDFAALSARKPKRVIWSDRAAALAPPEPPAAAKSPRPANLKRLRSTPSSEQLTPAQFVKWWIPAKPHATNNFARDGLHRCSRTNALSKIFIQTQLKTLRNLIVVDLDDDEPHWKIKALVEEDESLPAPSFIIQNRATGHAHVGWFIEEVASSDKALHKLKILTEQFTIRLGGDPAYHGGTMRNPLHQNHFTAWGTSKRYSFAELSAFVSDIDIVVSARASKAVDEGHGRNHTIFTLTSDWAYKNGRHYPRTIANLAKWNEAVLRNAQAINDAEFASNPLPANEVTSIAKSVANWVWKNIDFTKEGLSKRQAARSHKAPQGVGKPKRYTEAVMMSEAGMTAREVGEALSLSQPAAKKLVQRAKKWQAENYEEFLSLSGGTAPLEAPVAVKPRCNAPSKKSASNRHRALSLLSAESSKNDFGKAA